MADSINFDFSEILALSADLGEVPGNAGRNIRKAIEVTARHIKDDWRGDVTGSTLAPGGQRSISYDIRGGNAVRGSEISAEIGPELRDAGPLVGLLEYGVPGKNGPRGYGAAALERNQADFQKGLEIALDQAEQQAGL